MFTKDDLRELAAYEAEEPLLSIYLNVDPTERTRDECKLALRKILKDVGSEASSEDVQAVRDFFDHQYDWSGRGVAVFSGAYNGFWRTYSLAVPVPSTAIVARKPYISPLVALMDTYGSHITAVVNRQGVRLLCFESGELSETAEWWGEDVRKLKKGRGSSGGPGRRGGAPVSGRHEEEVAQRNIRQAIEETERFIHKCDPQYVILAGADPTLSQFEEELPKHLQDLVVGTMNADVNTSEVELKERSLEMLRNVEQERQKALVDAVFTAAAKGERGVIRLADTLGAAHEGRIQTLVVAQGFRKPGYRCENCGYITDQALEKCPFCGEDFLEIPDAAEALVTQVIENGGQVEIVEDHPKIEEFGVGALLRY